ncbi:MAG TPA: glycosyltransferase family 39 protein [Chthoniobacterales bacterium]
MALAIKKPAIPSQWTGPLAVACFLTGTKLLVHFLTNGQYGYFRDELYFMACGEHLSWGYVDHAPLAPSLAKLSRLLLGDSLFALRLLPAVAGAVKVGLTGLLARELGGSRFAVALGCLCVLVAPGYLALDTLFSMNAFEPVFWTGCAYAIILALRLGNRRYWILFGVLAGLGLENKHSLLFFGVGLLAGLLLSPARGCFANRWFWLGGVIALALFTPNLVWEYRHDWATLEALRNVQATGKNVVLSPVEFLGQQAFVLLPFTLPVWVAGLWFYGFDVYGRRYRFLAIAYLVTLGLMIVLKGKEYYLLPIYPMLFAGGAVWWEKRFKGWPFAAWLKTACLMVLGLSGLVFAPFALPVLPVKVYLRYQHALGITPPKTEVGHVGPLPQHFGDMFGWPEMVAEVARVYDALPPAERVKAAIFAGNYGEAGAIDFFGPRYGLPKAISGHQTYFLWGPRDYTGEVMILLQANRRELESRFQSVEEAGTVGHPYAMGEEHYPILVGRGLKRPLREVWPRLKHWN